MTVLKVPGEIVTGPEGIQTTAVGKLSVYVMLHYIHKNQYYS